MNIYVLTQDLEIAGVVDDYTSLIWRPAYYDIGDFELQVIAKKDLISLLSAGRYLVRASDITVVNGVTTYNDVMQIKNTTLTTDPENGDYLTVSGRELKFLLHQRIVWTQTNIDDTAENAIRDLVTDNAISPTDEKRVIPDLILADSIGLTDTLQLQLTGEYLDEAIRDICTTYEYGWKIYISNNKLVFALYIGLDRSYGQNDRPYVVFADDYDNICNTSYELHTEDFANTALVGGEGEGTDRVYESVGADNEGLDRFETFVNAAYVSTNSDDITAETYAEMLKEQGNESLAQVALTEGFSGEVVNNTFKLGIDYGIGDIVTVANGYGISRNVRVLSIIESEDETGIKNIPQFNM